MRSFHAFVITAGLVLATFGCAKTTESSGIGTNTNWMRTCDAPSDCEGDEACVCGVCTLACTSSTDCNAVHSGASCEAVSETACGSQSAPSAACLQSCDSNADCTALEDGRCISGLCVPAPPPVAPRNDAGVEPTQDAGAEPTQDAGIEPTQDASVESTQDASVEPTQDASVVPDPLALTHIAGTIQITDAYTACETHRNCTLVSTACDACCQRGAIKGSLTNVYTEHAQAACESYQGGECDCVNDDVVARCQAGRCTSVQRDSLECYGPELNDETAYVPGSVGCSCDALANKSICTGPAGLICSWTGAGYAWAAVLDSPCDPPPDETCSEGEVRPTADDCLRDFDWCRILSGGEYCGVLVPAP
jgi:hypothetical protein